jgi:hypothetical protein
MQLIEIETAINFPLGLPLRQAFNGFRSKGSLGKEDSSISNEKFRHIRNITKMLPGSQNEI